MDKLGQPWSKCEKRRPTLQSHENYQHHSLPSLSLSLSRNSHTHARTHTSFMLYYLRCKVAPHYTDERICWFPTRRKKRGTESEGRGGGRAWSRSRCTIARIVRVRTGFTAPGSPSTSDVSKVTLAALRLPAGRFKPILSSFSLKDLPPFFDLALWHQNKTQIQMHKNGKQICKLFNPFLQSFGIYLV